MITYKHFGVMLDCSRNGVMKVEQVKKLIGYLQKMGYDSLELYIEDTFELPNEEYFGYLRGGYSGTEIQEIDAFAKAHGIELIPCIQTLAHFTNLVKIPHYSDIVDVNDILLIGEEKTYELIEKLFLFVRENFTSKHVNVGMDEAHLVGLGRYLDKNGYKNRYELLLSHLKKVCALAEKYGFTPHMWSDMFYRLQNDGVYYGENLTFGEEIKSEIPENVGLVYWDYYNDEKEFYDKMFLSHKDFNREVWFAGGAWCWNGFAPYNRLTFLKSKAAMQSVRENGIENVLVTMWGDNGKECSFFALLAALFTVRRYADGVFDHGQIKREFEETFQMNFDHFLLLDMLNPTKTNLSEECGQENPCKIMLYNDCFLGKYDVQYEKEEISSYGETAKKIQKVASKMGEFAYVFQTRAALASVLEYKANLGILTRKAYRSKDRKQLEKVIKRYSITEERIKDFYEKFRDEWERENKPFGWEIQDARLGGLKQRIAYCKRKLIRYVNGEIPCIEELEADLKPYSGLMYDNVYTSLISTSSI